MIDRLGLYRVNGKIFFDKIEAILYANKSKSTIEWDFCEDVFPKVNWTIEPDLSLDTLYRMRAQQIRDKYDYVLIMASGGADSTNVINSFLNNDIRVDEIVSAAPISGVKNLKPNNLTDSPLNTYSEIELAQIPLLKELASKFPNLKITLNDYFEDMLNYKTDEWLYKSSDFIHPTTVARYSLEKFKHLKNLAESGKKIAIVYGIDKPRLMIQEDSTIGCILSDLAVNVQRPAFENFYPNVDNVLFYYADDLPEIMIKQGHVLLKMISLPENEKVFEFITDLRKKEIISTIQIKRQTSEWERSIVVDTIYPSLKTKVFQAHKPTTIFMADHDAWFYKSHYQSRTYQMIESDFRLFTKSIDNMYFNKDRIGFISFSKFYKIGHVDKFKNFNLN